VADKAACGAVGLMWLVIVGWLQPSSSSTHTNIPARFRRVSLRLALGLGRALQNNSLSSSNNHYGQIVAKIEGRSGVLWQITPKYFCAVWRYTGFLMQGLLWAGLSFRYNAGL